MVIAVNRAHVRPATDLIVSLPIFWLVGAGMFFDGTISTCRWRAGVCDPNQNFRAAPQNLQSFR